MADLNDSPDNQRKRAELLDELKALQATLHLERGVDPSRIPLLDDVIEEAEDTDPEALGAALVDTPLEDDLAPLDARPGAQGQRHVDDADREIFLQEVIDAMMPEIEAELRRRMLALDDEILFRWYQQHLDDQ